MKKNIFLLFCLFEVVLYAQTPSVLRGPYLQNPTPSSIVIKWRTDTATNSRVSYGTSLNSLVSNVDSTGLTKEHTVKISNLAPFTQYYYSIGTASKTLSGPSANHHFTTAPPSGTPRPVRVWAIGDFGKGIQQQADVRDAYLNYVGNEHTDVWLWLGDNAYDTGTDVEFQTKVFEDTFGYNKIFPYMPFMPCPGNHDYGSISPPLGTINPQKHTGAYFDIIDVPTNGEAGGVPSKTELYYSFDYANIHFVSLNSELGSIVPSYDYIGAFDGDFENLPMVKWLRQDLAANTMDWTIVYWHQCPYSKGSHNSDDGFELYMKAMRDNFTPIVEEYGVDMVVCGHSHVYERSYLIKGHTGSSSNFNSANLINGSTGNFDKGQEYYKYTKTSNPNQGTVYVVCGNSASKDDNAVLNHPVMAASDGCSTCLGSFVLEIDNNRLDGKYLKVDGSIGDYFTIIKQDFPTEIKEMSSLVSEIKVIPNPFKNQAKIEYNLTQNHNLSIDLTDMSGRLIQNLFHGHNTEGKHTIDLDTESLKMSKGTYFLIFQYGNQVYHKQIVTLE